MRINPELKKDDRVILISMEGESLPPYILGTVLDNGQVIQGIKQYKMKWHDVDSGSQYSLISGIDKWVLESEYKEMLENRRKKRLGETSYKRNIYKKTKL